MNLFSVLIILLCVLSTSACKEDYTYPNVFTELAEVETDADGKIQQLTTDRGATFTIRAFADTAQFVPDTLYRMLTVFEPVAEHPHELLVHSAHPVFSELPKPLESFDKDIHTDPVDIQSIWKTDRYLNMILRVQTKDKPHKFHFIDKGIYPFDEKASNTRSADSGRQVLELTFYHDRKDDFEAFTTKYCFSIPLYPYADSMKKGDIVRLHLNTYKEGAIVREFEF